MSQEKPTRIVSTSSEPSPRSRIPILLRCIAIALLCIAGVEYFKYSTKINYEWFHCTPIMEPIGTNTSVLKIWARGGPSCDKRGEFKTIMKRITRDYEPNDQHLKFCMIENMNIGPIHYPLGEPKGEPGYIAYVGYNEDKNLVEEMCKDATLFNM